MEYLFIFITLALLSLLLSMIWPPDSPWSPWWRTNGKTANAIVSLTKINSNDVVYDLGCGDGSALIACGKKGARGVGIEIDPLRAAIAQVRIFLQKFSKRIIIKRESFFKTDISDATVVVLYLVPKTLSRLEKKFRKELKKDTKVITYMYPLPYYKLVKVDTKNNLFLYKAS